jgi:hypothetical protein
MVPLSWGQRFYSKDIFVKNGTNIALFTLKTGYMNQSEHSPDSKQRLT